MAVTCKVLYMIVQLLFHELEIERVNLLFRQQ